MADPCAKRTKVSAQPDSTPTLRRICWCLFELRELQSACFVPDNGASAEARGVVFGVELDLAYLGHAHEGMSVERIRRDPDMMDGMNAIRRGDRTTRTEQTA
eukprot:1853174-Rhodomonas_salina.1